MAENEEELKSLLMKVKEERVKVKVKDPDAGRDWGQEEKDERQLNGREFG